MTVTASVDHKFYW